jgi:hypothetical protein
MATEVGVETDISLPSQAQVHRGDCDSDLDQLVAGTTSDPSLVFANVPANVKINVGAPKVNAKDQKPNPDEKMDIEDELREHLRATGKTPSVIGAEAGVDYSQIYRFLNGQTQLRSGTMAKLCNWAGLTLIRQDESASRKMQQYAAKSGRQAPRPEEDRDENRRIEDRALELALEIIAKTAEDMKRVYRA